MPKPYEVAAVEIVVDEQRNIILKPTENKSIVIVLEDPDSIAIVEFPKAIAQNVYEQLGRMLERLK